MQFAGDGLLEKQIGFGNQRSQFGKQDKAGIKPVILSLGSRTADRILGINDGLLRSHRAQPFQILQFPADGIDVRAGSPGHLADVKRRLGITQKKPEYFDPGQ